MKRLHLLTIFLAYNLLCCKTLANIVVLDPAMSQSQALTQPYTLTKTVIADSNAIELDFKLNVVEFSDFDKVPGTKACLIPGAPTLSEPGKPQLSIINQIYRIPSVQPCQITVTDTAYIDFNVQLAPGERIACDGTVTNDNLTITPYNGYFPNNCAEETSVQFYRGLPIHHFSLNPITYNVTEQKVRVYNAFKVKLTYNRNDADLESNRSQIFKDNRKSQIQGICEIVESAGNDIGLPTYPKERTQDYLIITNRYMDGIDDFIDWKKNMGYRVHVVKYIPGKENDYDAYVWTWQEIQDVIKKYYYELDNLCYVLLWGSDTILPGIPFSEFNTGNIELPSNRKSVSAYSLMDGKGDFTPEFSVGRIYS